MALSETPSSKKSPKIDMSKPVSAHDLEIILNARDRRFDEMLAARDKHYREQLALKDQQIAQLSRRASLQEKQLIKMNLAL